MAEPPRELTYSADPAVYTRGVAIPANTPANSGGAINSYGVSPTLPAGLTLNPSTGAITGTPTAIAAIATYTVTGINTGGSTTASLAITVNDQAPGTLSYEPAVAVYTKGIPIPANSPTNLGGAILSYSV